MKKKIDIAVVILFSFMALVGCKKLVNKETQLIYDPLSEKEEYLMDLTGNKVLMYKLKNLPEDKKYEILLTYEVYKNGEKAKDEQIAGMMKDNLGSDNKEEMLGINFQENKIRFILAHNGSYSSVVHEIEENFNWYSQTYFTENIDLPIGSEAYIYFATSEDSISSNILGVPIDSNKINDLIKDNESCIFIKLSFKEI